MLAFAVLSVLTMLAMPEQSFAVESGWQSANEAGFARRQVHALVVVCAAIVIAAVVVE